jgi:hypothetical protein
MAIRFIGRGAQGEVDSLLNYEECLEIQTKSVLADKSVTRSTAQRTHNRRLLLLPE